MNDPAQLRRSDGQTRAVVLIHGLRVRPFSDRKVARAAFTSWQSKDSSLVQSLAAEADVYAFAYGQNRAVEEVAALPGLRDNIRRLRQLGYTEVVLVGHSAGGLVARHFVEDYPAAGVTKVIQVCTPNDGSSWANLGGGVCKSQREFVGSLTPDGRERCLRGRDGKRIPPSVEFVCLVGSKTGAGDGVVSCRSQWPEDLREQGIPAVSVRTNHAGAVRGREGIEQIVELVRRQQPRWDREEVTAAARQILGSR